MATDPSQIVAAFGKLVVGRSGVCFPTHIVIYLRQLLKPID